MFKSNKRDKLSYMKNIYHDVHPKFFDDELDTDLNENGELFDVIHF
jgi:hypothetical protein